MTKKTGPKGPTKYTLEILEKAKSYESDFYKKEEAIPTIAGLAHFLGIHRDTVYAWAERYNKFSDIVERVMTLQEKKLITGGLINKFNPTMAKLMLTKHGYKDKSESEVNLKELGQIDENLKKIAEE